MGLCGSSISDEIKKAVNQHTTLKIALAKGLSRKNPEINGHLLNAIDDNRLSKFKENITLIAGLVQLEDRLIKDKAWWESQKDIMKTKQIGEATVWKYLNQERRHLLVEYEAKLKSFLPCLEDQELNTWLKTEFLASKNDNKLREFQKRVWHLRNFDAVRRWVRQEEDILRKVFVEPVEALVLKSCGELAFDYVKGDSEAKHSIKFWDIAYFFKNTSASLKQDIRRSALHYHEYARLLLGCDDGNCDLCDFEDLSDAWGKHTGYCRRRLVTTDHRQKVSTEADFTKLPVLHRLHALVKRS